MGQKFKCNEEGKVQCLTVEWVFEQDSVAQQRTKFRTKSSSSGHNHQHHYVPKINGDFPKWPRTSSTAGVELVILGRDTSAERTTCQMRCERRTCGKFARHPTDSALSCQSRDCDVIARKSLDISAGRRRIFLVATKPQKKSKTLKPGFHYPSWRPELTGDRFPLPVNTGRQLG